MKTEPPIRRAKFTPPIADCILPRPRLDALVEHARACPLAWLAAPPGDRKSVV